MNEQVIGIPSSSAVFKSSVTTPNVIKTEKLVSTSNPNSATEVAKMSSRTKARYEKIYGKSITTDVELAEAKEAALQKTLSDRQQISDDLVASETALIEAQTERETVVAETTADLEAAYDGALEAKDNCPDWLDLDFDVSCPWFDLDSLKSALDLSKYKDMLDTLTNKALTLVNKVAAWGARVFGNIIRCGAYLAGQGKRNLDQLMSKVTAVNPVLTGMVAGAIMTGNYEGLTSDPVGMLKIALGDATPAQLKTLSTEDVFAVKDGDTLNGLGKILKKMNESDPNGGFTLSGSVYGASGDSKSGKWSDARAIADLLGTDQTLSWNAHNATKKFLTQNRDEEFTAAYGDYVSKYKYSDSNPINNVYSLKANTDTGVFTDPKNVALLELVQTEIRERNDFSTRSGKPLNLNHIDAKEEKLTSLSEMVVEVDVGTDGLTDEELQQRTAEEADSMRRVAAIQVMVDLGDITPDEQLGQPTLVSRYQSATGKSLPECYKDLHTTVGDTIGSNQKLVATNQMILASNDATLYGTLSPIVGVSAEEQFLRDLPGTATSDSGAIQTKIKSYNVV